MKKQKRSPHIVILGTGIAGLSCALKYADAGVKVTLIAKTEAIEGSTRYAQGGIASVWSKDDSFAEHIQDTLIAGAGLCQNSVVDFCIKEGPARVQELIELGVKFTESKDSSPQKDGTQYDLHREGGHGQRRILHSSDLTGLEIETALLTQIRKTPNIELRENHCAIDLITTEKTDHKLSKPTLNKCLGVYVLNQENSQVSAIAADLVILATGGAGKVYLYTTNPDVATGDGIAMAYRAGARIANMEFMQFHPTCLYHAGERNFLITEAMRGEGAILRSLSGVSFMEQYHDQASLAPRDIVARAIDQEMKRTGDKHVYLDINPIGIDRMKAHFPNIYETCTRLGIDLSRGLIPVVPAVHYTCGGVITNSHAETTLANLFAIGEVSSTGLHGANRLASNSLLEAVVFAHRCFESGMKTLSQVKGEEVIHETLPEWKFGEAVAIEEQIDIAATWYEIRSLMWNYVGIVRSNRRLERALQRIKLIKAEVNEYYWKYIVTKDLIELRNLVCVAELIIISASLRKESRGLHSTVDYPETNDQFYLKDTVL